MKKINILIILILGIICSVSVQAAVDLPSNAGAADGSGNAANGSLFPNGAEENTGTIQTNTSLTTPSSDTDQVVAAAATEFESVQTASEAQAVAYDRRSQESDEKYAEGFKQAAAEVIGCSAGQILGQVLSSLVSGLISSALGAVSNTAEKMTTVPVIESGKNLLNSNSQTSAETGTTVGAFGIGVIALPSWNSIAYCVVNAMITYVANSTIAWVQGGFEGNPSFVTNPEEFFKDLANLEASAFLQELAYGATGLNICEPFRAHIVLSIARDHVGGQQGYGGNLGYSQGGFDNGGGGNIGYGGCSLDDIAGNLEGFLRGDFSRGGWDSWFKISQIDSNNPYSTYFNLQAQLSGSVAKKTNLAQLELDWGKGFLSFRKCEDGQTGEDKSNCPITSPGVVIQGQLEKTLGLAKDRLVLAEKFDQVIAVVVNELIQVALDKVLESVEE